MLLTKLVSTVKNVPCMTKATFGVIILMGLMLIFSINTVELHFPWDWNFFKKCEEKFLIDYTLKEGLPSLSYETKQVRNRFLARNNIIHEVCGNLSLKESRKLKDNGLDDILFGEGHFVWCRIYKVASSYVEAFNNKISKNVKHIKPTPKCRRDFMIVRDPYSRMVSAYIDKFLTCPDWWLKFGVLIVKKFRPNATNKEKECGHDVSFPEFVKYFIYSQKVKRNQDGHFYPMSESCNPCKRPYGFIAHLETIKEDMAYVLETVNITRTLDHPDEEIVMKVKAKNVISVSSMIKRCVSMCSFLQGIWWSFQAWGFISFHVKFPLQEEDECDKITGQDFGELCSKAHLESIGKFDKHKQKRQVMVELFHQVPLQDRLKVQDLLALDFKLFGYEAQPDDLFPELA